MFRRVDSFGRERKVDFAAKSKAAEHFAEITRTIQSLDTTKARQGSGGATAKSGLLEALRLDVQNIARTARAIDQAEPGFAERFRLPDGQSQTALVTAADAFLAELQETAVAKKFIAYELPPEFVSDLTTDLQESSRRPGRSRDEQSYRRRKHSGDRTPDPRWDERDQSSPRDYAQ